MRLFRSQPKPFLEAELEDWHQAAWRWLITQFGGMSGLSTALVLPTRAFFPPCEAQGHARIEHVFSHVKRHAGLEDVHCLLVPQPEGPSLRIGEMVSLVRQSAAPAGTFGLEGNEPAITYDPELEADPVKLVAVLAHELAHLRIAQFAEELEGGRDANERATDLATVALGFGLFGANCAFGFERFQDPISQGWQHSSLGYLAEREWAFALAVWCFLTDRDVKDTERYLKAHIYADLRRASASLRQRPEWFTPLLT
jgi:hypothetical protein